MAILKKLAFLLVLSLSANVFAEQVSTVRWKGLNNNSNSVIIDPSEAQDLLNVDVTPTGQSVKKRSGYGLYKALATNKPILGLYHFFDSTGNDVQVAGSSTSLYGIVGGGTPTQLISSATLSSIWDCADSQGSAYCVNSNRNAYVKTNGATMTWYSAPLGTMVETTPDRVVVAGVSGFPNTIYVSESNTFTNFVVGINATSPFNEVIASQGSKLTHLRYGCGNLLWWKDQSFGVMAFDDQFNVQIRTVSDTIGTFDNTSAIDPGGNVWFRGQDGHTWKYDCSFLTKESIDISPNTQVTGSRISNAWTQTTAADFSAGLSSPTITLSTSSSSGDVVIATNTVSDTTNANFNGGVVTTYIDTTTVTNAFTLKNYLNDPLSSLSAWTTVNGTWQIANGFLQPVGATSSNIIKPTSIPAPSSNFLASIDMQNTDQVNWSMCVLDGSNNGYCLEKDVANAVLLSHCSPFGDTAVFGCRSRTTIGTVSGLSVGSSFHTYELQRDNATNTIRFLFDGVVKISGTNSTTTSFTTYRIYSSSGTSNAVYYKNAEIYVSSGNFTSRNLDSTLYPSYFKTFATSTNGNGSYSYSIKTSPDGSSYSAEQSLASGDNITSAGGRYIVYSATIAATTITALPQVKSASMTFVSTGTYYSAVHNNPNFTSWGTLQVTSIDNGGSHSFYVRGGTNTFSILGSTPTWTAVTAGSLIGASTGTYIQFRDDFMITKATHTPTLNDFTINWFEGSSTDQSYMAYFDNAIWESVAFGGGQTTNNYIFKKDLINDAWTVYNFGAGGLAVQANRLYFGDTAAGNVYIYGSATSDNGSAISAYWKGKDFTGQDPFLQNQLNKIDVFCKKDQGSTLTGTYTTDTSTATAYSINLSTSASVVQNRKLLPSGKLGYTMNYKLSDSSTSSAWECFGYRMDYNPLPYRPTYP